MPTPAPGLEKLLTELPRRQRDCATGLAVDAAVASRAAAINSRVSPAALAEHVTCAIRAALEGTLLCDGDQDGLEPQWLAPPYRWAIVLDDLAEFHRQDDHAGPHPDTSRWEAVYGRQIPGATCAAQLGAVNRWYQSDIADTARCWAVMLGSRVPSAIETATRARHGEPSWDQRLADSLDWFDDLHFPLKYLTSDPGAAPRKNPG